MRAPVFATAEQLDALANRVNRNGLSRVSPENFHAEKSDIAHQLRILARAARGDTRPEPSTTWGSEPRV